MVGVIILKARFRCWFVPELLIVVFSFYQVANVHVKHAKIIFAKHVNVLMIHSIISLQFYPFPYLSQMIKKQCQSWPIPPDALGSASLPAPPPEP